MTDGPAGPADEVDGRSATGSSGEVVTPDGRTVLKGPSPLQLVRIEARPAWGNGDQRAPRIGVLPGDRPQGRNYATVVLLALRV